MNEYGHLGIRTKKTLIEKLKKLAELDNRNLSNYVETVLNDHVAAKDV